MKNEHLVEIRLSRKKIIAITVGSLLFVLLGVLLLVVPEPFQSVLFCNETFIRIAGSANILFFGATGIYGMFKLRDPRVGLTLLEEGIIDHTHAASIGLIKWEDIESIQTVTVMSTRMLLLFTHNQETFLNSATGMKKRLMQANAKLYGTPLSLTANTLECDFETLEKLVRERFHEAQKALNTGA